MDLADIVKYNIAYTKQLKQTEAKPLQTSPSYLKYILDKQGEGIMNDQQRKVYKQAYAWQTGVLDAERDHHDEDERSEMFHDRPRITITFDRTK